MSQKCHTINIYYIFFYIFVTLCWYFSSVYVESVQFLSIWRGMESAVRKRPGACRPVTPHVCPYDAKRTDSSVLSVVINELSVLKTGLDKSEKLKTVARLVPSAVRGRNRLTVYKAAILLLLIGFEQCFKFCDSCSLFRDSRILLRNYTLPLFIGFAINLHCEK